MMFLLICVSGKLIFIVFDMNKSVIYCLNFLQESTGAAYRMNIYTFNVK